MKNKRWLALWRERANLSHQAVDDQLMFSSGTIQKYENSEFLKIPTVDLMKLINLYSIDFAELEVAIAQEGLKRFRKS